MLSINELQSLAAKWLMVNGLEIIVIIVGAWITHFFLLRVTARLVRKMVISSKDTSAEAEKKREDTLIKIIHGSIHIALVVIVALMILSNLGIEIGPLLAAAGIAGLAFGFGGQYLIKDVITGLFIVLENQYRVNDVVCFDGTCGLVEDITLRMTTLRDLDGTVHHVPHGQVGKVSNLSKVYSRVNINLGISYNSDLEKVIEVVNKVGNELAQDESWKGAVITPPQFLRVEEFADSAIVIKILGDTQPIKQWDVAGELRKRLKIAFDKEGIEIPFPQMVVHKSR